MAHSKNSRKTARYRAKLKAKHTKVRRRKCGFMAKRKSGGHMKVVKRAKLAQVH